ncbi:unnamed protein product, partial [Closterium sp. Yama58-4]
HGMRSMHAWSQQHQLQTQRLQLLLPHASNQEKQQQQQQQQEQEEEGAAGPTAHYRHHPHHPHCPPYGDRSQRHWNIRLAVSPLVLFTRSPAVPHG